MEAAIAKKDADLRASHVDLEKRILASTTLSDSQKDQNKYDLEPNVIIDELNRCKEIDLNALSIAFAAFDEYQVQVCVVESTMRRASILKEVQIEALEREFKAKEDAIYNRLSNRFTELLRMK